MVSRNDKIAIAVGVTAAAGLGIAAVLLAHGGPPPPGQPVVTAIPSSVLPGQNVNFNVTGGTFLSFAWDFGDGQTTSTTVPQAFHSYGAIGTYTVRVSTTDSANNMSSATTTVVVSTNPPLNVTTALTSSDLPTTANVNQTVAVTGTLTRTDQGSGIQNETIDIQVSPNQVSWSTVTTAITDALGNYAAGIMFTAPGTYYVRASFAGGLVV